jgi:hypothetical protein
MRGVTTDCASYYGGETDGSLQAADGHRAAEMAFCRLGRAEEQGL